MRFFGVQAGVQDFIGVRLDSRALLRLGKWWGFRDGWCFLQRQHVQYLVPYTEQSQEGKGVICALGNSIVSWVGNMAFSSNKGLVEGAMFLETSTVSFL